MIEPADIIRGSAAILAVCSAQAAGAEVTAAGRAVGDPAEIVVYGRAIAQIGIASSGSQGVVG